MSPRHRRVHRVTYAPPADDTLTKMGDAEAFRAELVRTLGRAPYDHGSTPVRDDPDRREATVRSAIVLYYVSASVHTLTVVRLILSP